MTNKTFVIVMVLSCLVFAGYLISVIHINNKLNKLVFELMKAEQAVEQIEQLEEEIGLREGMGKGKKEIYNHRR